MTAQGPSVSRFSAWMARWLSAYLVEMPNSAGVAEVTFIYALAVSRLGDSNGRVSRDSGVIEIGGGSDPVGPPGGVEISFFDLAGKMIEILSD
ncbi:hypothetical protein [Frankia sp. Cas4]|uniref:hypothetical protein n=1 Tax=Frankia sp. Cas4 TaxID=3073927 RepID=UPI002AD3DE33|nr:hypothetical protein [Frankia sp. Cas4]